MFTFSFNLLSIEANTTTNPPPPTPKQEIATFPQQLFNQLTAILQQSNNTQGATSSDTSTKVWRSATRTTDDDHLSVASEPGQTTSCPPVQVAPIPTSTQVNSATTSTTATAQHVQSSTPQPSESLPFVLPRIQDKISRGE